MILNKLKILREMWNMNQAQFAKILDISQPSYSRIEAGKSEICADALLVLFHKKGVSPLWFFYGIDPIIFPFDEVEKNKLSQLKIEKLKTSDANLNNKQEEDIIYYFRSLKDEQKEIAFFKVMYELSKIKEENK